jgi:hypothetical protein
MRSWNGHEIIENGGWSATLCALLGCLAILLGVVSEGVAQPAALIVLRPEGADVTSVSWLGTARAALEKQGVLLLDEAINAQRTHRPGLDSAPSPSRVAALEASAAALLEAAAYGRDAEVITRGTLELAAVEPELTQINRADAAASALLDICLLVVRAMLHAGDDASAAREAERCAWRVPDLSPHPDLHPPHVVALAAEARTGEVAVLRAAGLGSSGQACELRAQGRPLGGLPSAHTLVPGRYQIQVDCGQPGFVHEVELRARQTSTLEVALDLERRTGRSGGVLTYAVAQPADDLAGLWQLTVWLGVTELWVAYDQPQPTLALLRRSGAQLTVTGTRVLSASPAPQISEIASAVEALTCRGCAGGPELPPPLPPARIRAGLGLGAIGLAGVLTSWALLPVHNRLDDDLSALVYVDPAYEDKGHQLQRIDRSAVAVSSSGAALLVAASAIGLPTRRPQPWSPAMIATMAGLGAVSVALIVSGAMVLSRHEPLQPTACPMDQQCLRERTSPLGPMLLTQGLGLLSVPLTYTWRSWSERSQSVSLQASQTGITAWFRATSL